MKTAKRDDQTVSQHNRSTSRFSINRIHHAKSPDNIATKSIKPSNSFLNICPNKQNIDINNRKHQASHCCEATTIRQQSTRRQHPHPSKSASIVQVNTDNFVDKLLHGYSHQEDALTEIRKRFNAQLNEKDMVIMQTKNSTRKAELEVKKRDKAIDDYEKIVQSKDKTIVSLTVQNSSLISAIDLLKTQQAHSTALHQSTLNECSSLKRQLITKAAENKKLQQQLAKAHKDMQIYNSLEPRLKELEQLQDRLIDQNQRAKDDRQVFVSTLRNIERILRSSGEQTAESRQIYALISSFLN